MAVLVYDRWGLSVLRRAWINLDGVWAGAFVLAGVADAGHLTAIRASRGAPDPLATLAASQGD